MDKITIEEGLAINGYYISTIVGDSMMPMLRNRRDTVKIVPAETPLKKYDLPLYRRPTGECVLHRIVKVKKGYYIICGDNRYSREKVPFEWIIGVMQSFYRDDKEISADNKEYVKYVKRVQCTYWPRRIKRKIKKILRSRELKKLK